MQSLAMKTLLSKTLILMCFCLSIAVPVLGQEEAEFLKGKSIESYLLPDGRFDLEAARRSGVEGALDFGDYRGTIDKETGEPIFIPVITDDTSDYHWRDGFYYTDFDDSVSVLAIYNNDLIAGGAFHFAAGAAVNHIARWDGNAWNPLGSGMDDVVYALTVYEGELIAGGFFTVAGGIEANHIARWNGSDWSALGSGMIGNAVVRALAIYNGDLIAGGYFATAGGVTSNHIARWDGNAWNALGSGTNSTVYALSIYGGELIAGGNFTTAGGINTNYIASWNGSVWSTLGYAMNGTVQTLTVYNGDLIAGGWFTTADYVMAYRIARWDGSTWNALGSGLNAAVRALTVYNGELMVGGWFTIAGGDTANHIASWNGSTWSSLASGVDNRVQALIVYDEDLITGGYFESAGGLEVLNIARWNGNTWNIFGSSIGNGMNAEVRALTVYNGNVIAGGDFTIAGGVVVNHIALWDGSTWSSLGSGMNAAVLTLIAYDGYLIAGGDFTTAGGSATNHIARWDGSNWNTLGNGMNSRVLAMTIYNGDLVVGGNFTYAGGVSAHFVARWDGYVWDALGSGMNTGVRALTVYNGDLIAGGDFTIAGGVTVNQIASWNGNAWSDLGGGVGGNIENSVIALVVYNGDLIAGGNFITAGGITVNDVASWDGSSWSDLDGGILWGYVNALTVYNGDLITGGNFAWVGGSISANFIARWDGSGWGALESGMNSLVTALTVYDSNLTVGGYFTTAGDKASSYIAFWSEFGNTPVEISITPILDSTSIAGEADFLLSIINKDSSLHNFSASIDGIDSTWYEILSPSFISLPGQTIEDTIHIDIPSQAGLEGEYPFDVDLYVSTIDSTFTRSATLRVVNDPIIELLYPPDSITTSAVDLNFSWYTSAICSSEVYIKPSDSTTYSVYTGNLARNHSVLVSGLSRDIAYDWYVRSAGDWGGARVSEIRHLYIDNGVSFVQDSYYQDIQKDYNQRFDIAVVNTDSVFHPVWLEVENTYDDIAINFVDDGSPDNELLLNPGETGHVTLAAHAQDAALSDYFIMMKLNSITESDTIVDYSDINIHIDVPYIDASFEEISIDSGTLAKTYRFINNGDPITDLSLEVSDSLLGRVYFEPQVSHAYLLTNDTIFFQAIPILQPDDTVSVSLRIGESKNQSFPSEELLSISGSITANYMGESTTLTADFSPPPGESIYLAQANGIYQCFNKRDWYCTNRDSINVDFNLSPMQRPNDAFFQMTLTPNSGWQHRPHSVYIYVNDILIGSILNTIPNGTYSFAIDPDILVLSSNQVSVNRVTINTIHMNGGHYVVSSNMSICVCLDVLERYISAESQEQANDRLLNLAGIAPPSAVNTVTINLPSEGADLNLSQPALVKATVLADGEPGIRLPVIATFDNGDNSLVLFDDGNHNDEIAEDGIYANTWHPGAVGACSISVRAGNCAVYGTDDVNVNVLGPSSIKISILSPQENFIQVIGRNIYLRVLVSDNFGNAVAGNDMSSVWASFDCEPLGSVELFDDGNHLDFQANDGTFGGMWNVNPVNPGQCTITFEATHPTLGVAIDSVAGTIVDLSLNILDGSGEHNPIPNMSFYIFQVYNDPPNMTELYKGELTTNSIGQIFVPAGWFDIGDWIKVEKQDVFTQDAVKHTSFLPDMYTIYLDNAKIDVDTGFISYDSLTSDIEQDIIMDHPTIMYDLMVSVEWDASIEYLNNMVDGFKSISNYLYDVTNGQLFIHELHVFDAKVNWDSSDIQIHASNVLGPVGSVEPGPIPLGGGIFYGGDSHIYYPRIVYHNVNDPNRNLSFTHYPYDWTISDIEYQGGHRDYPCIRTLAHEFGHYGIGFRDEYVDYSGNYLYWNPDHEFGLMDDQLKPGIEQNSEMSSWLEYDDPTYQVTRQWVDRGDRSCWDYFKWNYEGYYPAFNIYVPIKTPINQMAIGPNNTPDFLDYDVGALMDATISDSVCASGPAFSLIIFSRDMYGNTVGNSPVTLFKNGGTWEIDQGNTADNGGIVCLGVNNGDIIRAYPNIGSNWMVNEITVGQPGRNGNAPALTTLQDGDTVEVTLMPIAGEFRMINKLSFQSSDIFNYEIEMNNYFSQNPTLNIYSYPSPIHTFNFTQILNGYNTSVNQPLNTGGILSINAIDDSSSGFFIDNRYVVKDLIVFSSNTPVYGPNGFCELVMDSLNYSIEKILILSSDYPCLMNGLDSLTGQIAAVHSICSYPNISNLIGANNYLVMRYSDFDLTPEIEAGISLYKWNNSIREWQIMGGQLDTSLNRVRSNITELGIYSLFSENVISGCDYEVGDVNGSDSYNGLDITYGVNFFKSIGPDPLCPPGTCTIPPCDAFFYCGDVNGSCSYNGLDITYGVNYFKGGDSPIPCGDCSPPSLLDAIDNEEKAGLEYNPDGDQKKKSKQEEKKLYNNKHRGPKYFNKESQDKNASKQSKDEK